MDNNNEGFKFLKEAFAKFAAKYDGSDVAGRVVRSLAAGGKAAVDRGLQEFPKNYVSQVVSDIYELITSPELAQSISASITSFDEEKIRQLLEGVTAQLKDRDTALNVARQLKDALRKVPSGDLLAQVDAMMDMANLPPQVRVGVQVFLNNAKPILDDMKYKSEEEIADQLSDLADLIPADLLAMMVSNITKDFTPENVAQKTAEAVGKMESPQAVADIVHGVGQVVSKHLDQVSQAGTVSDVPGILREMAQNIQDTVADIRAKDEASKNTFNPKKGRKKDFDF